MSQRVHPFQYASPGEVAFGAGLASNLAAVRALATDGIQPPPEGITGLNGRYLEGLAHVGERLVLILDVTNLLDPDTVDLARAAAANPRALILDLRLNQGGNGELRFRFVRSLIRMPRRRLRRSRKG